MRGAEPLNVLHSSSIHECSYDTIGCVHRGTALHTLFCALSTPIVVFAWRHCLHTIIGVIFTL